MAHAALRGLDGKCAEICVGKARVAAWLDRITPRLSVRMMARE